MEKYKIVFRSIEEIDRFVALSGKRDCDMDIGEGAVLVDAKSIEGLIALGLNKNVTLTVYGELDEEMKNYVYGLQ